MKENPRIQRIVERMTPGVLSRDGFLGTDIRPLEEIIEADRAFVAQLGSSHQELGRKLEEVFLAARAALGTKVLVGDRLNAVHKEAMGHIPCPWGRCGMFAKGYVELLDTQSGLRIMFTALNVHMVTAHGFYQGRGSRYRLEPAEIYRLLVCSLNLDPAEMRVFGYIGPGSFTRSRLDETDTIYGRTEGFCPSPSGIWRTGGGDYPQDGYLRSHFLPLEEEVRRSGSSGNSPTQTARRREPSAQESGGRSDP